MHALKTSTCASAHTALATAEKQLGLGREKGTLLKGILQPIIKEA